MSNKNKVYKADSTQNREKRKREKSQQTPKIDAIKIIHESCFGQNVCCCVCIGEEVKKTLATTNKRNSYRIACVCTSRDVEMLPNMPHATCSGKQTKFSFGQ